MTWEVTADHTPDPHGRRYTYQQGCRCEACVTANRVYSRRHQRRRYVPAGPFQARGYRRKDGTIYEIVSAKEEQ